MKNRLFDMISSGLPLDTHIEPLRKVVLINLIILPGSFFLAVLGVIATVEHDVPLALADLLILVCTGIAAGRLRRVYPGRSVVKNPAVAGRVLAATAALVDTMMPFEPDDYARMSSMSS